MATTDLKLEEAGTLPSPGPIGRTVRFAFGGVCLYYVVALWILREHPMAGAGALDPLVWNGILPGLFLISYVINIGFSRAWKKRPAIASAGMLLGVAGLGYLQTGEWETVWLARTVHLWEFYLFSHLGLCFVVAAVIGSPGCEMRAFHHLYERVTGHAVKEHHCPVGPLQPIDRWEAARRERQ